MNPIIEKVVQPVVNRTLSLANAGFKSSRQLADTGSKWLAASTSTVANVSDKALKLNKISHKTVEKLLNEQQHIVAGTLKSAATRLDVAANADSIQYLWQEQLELMPKTRQRLTKNARNVISIFANTREELSDLVNETVSDFGKRGDTIKKTAKKAQKTVKKTAGKAVKKTRTTAKTAKKKTTRVAKKTAKRRTKRAA